MTPTLDYQPPQNFRTVHVDPTEGGGVTVTIPTLRTAAKAAWDFVAAADILGVLLFPILWPICLVTVKRTPRAVIQVTKQSLTFAATEDRSLGILVERRQWPITPNLEIYRNRYDGGMEIRIAGQDTQTVLMDLPPEVIDKVVAALVPALASTR